MKKKLLGTSALVAILTAVGGAQVNAEVAQAPALSISGNAKFQAYGFKNTKGQAPATGQPSTSPRYGYGQGYAFTENGELDFVIAGVAKNGLEYNYTLILTGDTNASNAIQENRIEFKGNWGTFQAGDKIGPEDVLMTDAANVLGATGGFDGDWDKVINQTTGVFVGDSMSMDTGAATKAIYYTPRFNGFMLGASFTPSSSHKGNSGINTNNGTSGGANYNNHGVSSGALNYSHEFQNGFGLSLTLAGMSASSSKSPQSANNGNYPINLRTMKAWQAGALFNYQSWQMGFGYIDNQKSGTIGNSGTNYSSVSGYDGGRAWSTALGYTFGNSKVAVGYQGSTQKNGNNPGGGHYKGKADVYSVTADHTLAPGLGVYAEYDYLHMRVPNGALAGIASNQVINNVNNNNGTNQTSSNRAQVFILGTKISF